VADFGAVPPPVHLTGVLETVLYHEAEQTEEMERFYGEVLGLRRLGGGLNFRLGAGVLLLFDAAESSVQETPPPHGARGPVHICFLAPAEEYEGWKEHLAEHGVATLEERTWASGVRSFYFRDPAGNVLEIAEGDLWPR
jgi:catechol 2,3-dioxygenase-like lactoylglutathione lyase family enzyme